MPQHTATSRRGETIDHCFAAFAELADGLAGDPELIQQAMNGNDLTRIEVAAAGRLAELLLILDCDAELVETCRARYAREGGAR